MAEDPLRLRGVLAAPPSHGEVSRAGETASSSEFRPERGEAKAGVRKVPEVSVPNRVWVLLPFRPKSGVVGLQIVLSS